MNARKTAVSDPTLPNSGATLRALRRTRNMTLKDVSALTGVSISTLSKFENGKTGLNFRNALQLAEGLGVPISTFMGDIDQPRATTARLSVVRAGDAKIIQERQLVFENISGGIKHKKNIFFRVTVIARSINDYDELHYHDGEEFLLVLKGPVEIHTEHYDTITLQTDDTIQFDSGMGHAYVSTGRDEAVLLMSNTLPVENAADQIGLVT